MRSLGWSSTPSGSWAACADLADVHAPGRSPGTTARHRTLTRHTFCGRCQAPREQARLGLAPAAPLRLRRIGTSSLGSAISRRERGVGQWGIACVRPRGPTTRRNHGQDRTQAPGPQEEGREPRQAPQPICAPSPRTGVPVGGSLLSGLVALPRSPTDISSQSDRNASRRANHGYVREPGAERPSRSKGGTS